MPTQVIIGAQWGDEAKGKIVDVLSASADMVVRYSGGNNAGHTVIVDGQVHKFHLLPAGILYPHITAVLGAGTAICPKALLDEIDRSTGENSKLAVSPCAHVVFPYHRYLDQLEEEARGVNKIGTTSRGIGPCYTDKVQRIGIRMGEFVRPEIFTRRFREVIAVKNRMLAMFGHEPLDVDGLLSEFTGYAARLAPYVVDTEALVADAVAEGKRVLFEGAQGTFLDLDHGTYPYVTSSHPIAAGACLGTGVGPRDIDMVLGVCKAYTTRVGSGPFPSELLDEVGDQIREQGQEYGTTTGRPRRCGWLDLVALKRSARINSLGGLIVTRLDVLSGIGPLKFVVGYEGVEGGQFPTLPDEWQVVKPVYRENEGWDGDIRGVRRFEDLPKAVRDYVRVIEEQTGVPAAILSIGPDRSETIIVRPDLVWG